MTRVVLRESRGHAPRLVLSRDEVHVWTITLGDGDGRGEAPDALSADETERASRFRLEADRRRFVAAHAGLRSILAAYLGNPPASLVFDTGPAGKPGLDHRRHDTTLRFNLSDSHDLALVAVACRRDVGVDVERMRAIPDLEGIVARFFSPAERAALGGLPRDDRLRAFFQCWTLKEACLKACGQGISEGLERLDVGVDVNEPPAIVRGLAGPGDERRWELFPLAPGRDYLGAVAVSAP
jgi:4'-phosphopantetheinyl transferase